MFGSVCAMMIFSGGVMKSAATTTITKEKNDEANTKSAQPRFAHLFPYRMYSSISYMPFDTKLNRFRIMVVVGVCVCFVFFCVSLTIVKSSAMIIHSVCSSDDVDAFKSQN